MPYRLMDPSDSLTWEHDWADVLATSETIASRVWTIEPDSSPTLIDDTTSAAVIVFGLSLGMVYRVSEKMTTTFGNVHERSVTIRCEHR